MKLVFEHPHTPPGWLDKWLSNDELNMLVPAGLRQYALELGGRDRIKRLHWDESSLVLLIGSQRCAWRLNDNGGDGWKTSCTCGYPKKYCAHVYLAGYLFDQVRRQENWSEQTPLFTWNAERKSDSTLAPAPAPLDSHLEIEADFMHRPGSVAVRVYHVTNGMRKLLTMQRLYNLGMRVRHSATAEKSWSADESAFLEWCTGALRRRPEVRKNLNLLNLTRDRFDQWLERWGESSIPFFDRANQRELGGATGPCRIVISARDEGEKLRLTALVKPPQGDPVPFPEVFKMMSAGQREPIVNGRTVEIESAISWQTLCELFGAKSPGLAKKHVCEHLGTILEGRFDILEGAPFVFDEKRLRAKLQAESSGAEIVVTATLAGMPMLIDKLTTFAPPQPHRGKFLITRHTVEGGDELREFFDSLDSVAGAAPGVVRIPGRVEAMARLAAAWKSLPATVDKHCDSALTGLLQPKDCTPVPELTVHDRGVFFNVSLNWRIGDEHALRHDVVHTALSRGKPIVRTDSGKWVALDPAWVETIIGAAAEAGFGRHAGQRLFLPELREKIESLKKIADETRLNANAECLTRIKTQTIASAMECPPHLRQVLRPYQHDGFSFLSDRVRYGIGCILADDMGLGKTVQALALLSALHEQKQRSADSAAADCEHRMLVVCPASVLAVWRDEAQKFAPHLRCRLYRGDVAERQRLLDSTDYDLLLANYAIVRRDFERLAGVRFTVGVLDEAQRIKNPDAQVTQAIAGLNLENRVALTGTPLENHPLDLWSIMQFLNSGYLGERDLFANSTFDNGTAARLAARLKPVMLRRTKRQVAPELPERIEEVITVEASEDERRFYDETLQRGRSELTGKGTMEMLALLTRLRQVCCAPELVAGGAGLPSAKLEACMELVEELVDEGHSVLVFSQFVKMLDVINRELDRSGIRSWRITGATPVEQRPQIVRDFSDSEKEGVMLLSLKAAGTGLTLTKADYVILYDPWWNPAVENQAIDRTHRIGQKNNVIAYRLVVADTVEENVQKLKMAKRELFDAVVEGAADPKATSLSRDMLEQILA